MSVTSGKIYPVLPLRDIVVFPHMIVPLFVGREKSVKALEDVMGEDKQILLVSQKDASVDDPNAEDIYEIGTLSTILQLLKLPDGTVKVLVEGFERVKISEFSQKKDFFEAFADSYEDHDEENPEIEALARSVINEFEQYIKLNKKISPEVLASLNQIEDYSKLADTVAAHLSLKISDKQEIKYARIASFGAIAIAAYFGINPPSSFVAKTVAFAFGLAASSFFTTQNISIKQSTFI